MSLNAWQERLSAHFGQLRDERQRRTAHATVYAIEHGLDENELAELTREIHDFLMNSPPARRHYLAWAVYSAEIGYSYSGEEYWDTFASRTPNWDHSYRDTIRDAYYDFYCNFKATRPGGRWANHFKIICWPITHAILPQDLQRELAQVLYDLRGAFTPQLLQYPDCLGQRISDNAWNSGARFRKFAENHALVGQISTALLLSDEEKQHALILPATLDRITNDLNGIRRCREWLSHARQQANQVNVRGLTRQRIDDTLEPSGATSLSLTSRQRDVLDLGIEPDLFLVKTAPTAWDVRLKLADLSRLGFRFPNVRSAIANQHCTIAGAEPRTFPKGYLLYGDQQVSLKRWPESDEVLIKFECPHKELDYLLTAECLLRPGPTWLFKMSNDGTARHIKTGIVKPGNSYLIVRRGKGGLSYPSELNSATVTLSCEGVSAFRLEVPDVVSKIYSGGLDSLHLHLSAGLEVAPIGLPAAKWSDTGLAEWISTDQPLIRVSADFDVDGILLNLVGPKAETLELQKPLWPLLVEIGKLNTGVYELHVIASRAGAESLVRGHLQFTIREPRVWNGEKPGATAFVAHVSPAAPTLEELWQGDVVIELLGPDNQKVEGEIKFFANGSGLPILERKFGPIGLPCAADRWNNVWQKITADKETQNAFDACAECELVIHCDFGRYVLRAVRESKPLRWIVKQENNGYFLRFEQLDDQAAVTFSRYPFRTPTEVNTVSENPFLGFRVSEDGGLFVASTHEDTVSVIIPPVIHSLKWLSADVLLKQGTRSEGNLGQLLRTLEVWSSSRAIGNLFALKRKVAVEDMLTEELIRLFCGDEWLDAEHRYKKSLIRVEDLKNFVSPAVRFGPLGQKLISKSPELQTQTSTENVELLHRLSREYLDLPSFSTAHDHGVSRQQWAVEFAYRVFTGPGALRKWAQQDFVPGLGYLLKVPILCRLIRFAFLLSEGSHQTGIQTKAATT